ncbi:hypothetical protein E2C01_028349 [Portunus trituberculatus]|uniref:Uncharacterized protein n=1 Tax=Portunus trituberculatus TaxID=210409 RepID=A0A5B7ENE3_PORTR|nr:hypothetical protein [Portunus trituberculatus]
MQLAIHGHPGLIVKPLFCVKRPVSGLADVCPVAKVSNSNAVQYQWRFRIGWKLRLIVMPLNTWLDSSTDSQTIPQRHKSLESHKSPITSKSGSELTEMRFIRVYFVDCYANQYVTLPLI